jgi:hypothetical protein
LARKLPQRFADFICLALGDFYTVKLAPKYYNVQYNNKYRPPQYAHYWGGYLFLKNLISFKIVYCILTTKVTTNYSRLTLTVVEFIEQILLIKAYCACILYIGSKLRTFLIIHKPPLESTLENSFDGELFFYFPSFFYIDNVSTSPPPLQCYLRVNGLMIFFCVCFFSFSPQKRRSSGPHLVASL